MRKSYQRAIADTHGTPQQAPADLMPSTTLHAATDVTGFGLTGHAPRPHPVAGRLRLGFVIHNLPVIVRQMAAVGKACGNMFSCSRATALDFRRGYSSVTLG